jgi:hypothetical protein
VGLDERDLSRQVDHGADTRTAVHYGSPTLAEGAATPSRDAGDRLEASPRLPCVTDVKVRLFEALLEELAERVTTKLAAMLR